MKEKEDLGVVHEPIRQRRSTTLKLDKIMRAPDVQLEKEYGVVYFEVLQDVTIEELREIVDRHFPQLLTVNLDHTEEHVKQDLEILLGRLNKLCAQNFGYDELDQQVNNPGRPNKKYNTENISRRTLPKRANVIRNAITQLLKDEVVDVLFYPITEKEYEQKTKDYLNMARISVEQAAIEMELMADLEPELFTRVTRAGQRAVQLRERRAALGLNQAQKRVDPDYLEHVYTSDEERRAHQAFRLGIQMTQSDLKPIR